ncbi:MAG TPA: hypothetical protein VMT46_13320 [Anaerolineaceae bacterium]|nr:hypothetical protein [Anaerolineaceae bacterium]
MPKKSVRPFPKKPVKKPGAWRKVLLGLAGLIGLAILAVAGFIIYSAVRRSQPVSLPVPTGPYAVGRMEFDWTDPARLEIFSGRQGQHREISAWVWYPAEPGSGQPAPYLPKAWADARSADRAPAQVFFQDLNRVQSHSLQNAKLIAGSQRFPVIVFSTGYGGIAPEYATLEEDLASRGYVVVGVTNPYSAPQVVFPDGRQVDRTAAGSISEESQAASVQTAQRLVAVWSLDIRLALDQIERMDTDPASPFSSRLDINKVGLTGHSLGGAASVLACGNDFRCKGAVDLDGTLYGDPASIGIGPPVFFVTSEPAGGEPGDEPTFAASKKHGAQQVEILGAHHFNFEDYSLTYMPLFHILGALGPVDGARALQASRDLLADFFGERLLQQPGGVGAVLQKYPGLLVLRR